ncbi:hypothetical protein AB0F71_13235 [Kitasatospora sp. NPDC028055]|uniref:hypothetical protein n=1 Tax=Kitasatospora sp. NPDC028055 TaxID=3155653 RepID=UPI0033DA169F
MRRSSRFLGAASLVATAVLAAACTDDGTAPAPQQESGPWFLEATAAAPADAVVQRSIDAPPAKGTAKILGIADVSGTSVVLAVRNGTCQVAVLPDGLTDPTATAPDSVGAPRPTASSFADTHVDFPGNVLAGTYTQASAQLSPFKFTALGCGEKAMAVRLEGAGKSAEARKKAGDSLRLWKNGADLVLAVGTPEAVHQAPTSG